MHNVNIVDGVKWSHNDFCSVHDSMEGLCSFRPFDVSVFFNLLYYLIMIVLLTDQEFNVNKLSPIRLEITRQE